MKQNSAATYSFPWQFCLLNALIYFLARLDIIEIISWGSISVIPALAILPTVATVVLVIMSSPFQAAAYMVLRNFTRRKLVYAVLFLWPGTLLGGIYLYWSVPALRARTLLEDLELAPLPKSAAGLRIASWSSGFAGDVFLRFRASREDIEAFLNNSPALKDAECQKYSKERMRLGDPLRDEYKPPEPQDDREYFTYNAFLTPPWYLPEIRVAGRRYAFSARKFGHGAEVVYDEEQNLVFVHLNLG
ncbi:MAG: hypothetical protein JSU70_02045 [Phycisphaerales bacterium]|nr:MAG: hypothetical protein JSU70_02045 [Phycisphaerales bacterium]